MHPILIDLGTHDLPFVGETHLFLPTYGFLFAVGALLAWWWFIRRGRAIGVPDEQLFNLSFYALLAGILGAKLLLVLLDWHVYAAHPRELLGVLRSAGVLVGGIVAGALTFALYAWRHGLPLLRLGDAIAAPLALGQAVGRLGCFSAGCCWGKPAAPGNPFAVTFTDPEAHARTGVPLGTALVPTQLIEMTADLALVLLLAWAWRRRPRPAGTVFWIYVLLYSISRGIVEFWRGDAARGLYLGGRLSTSQIAAAAGIVLSVFMLLLAARRHRVPAEARS